MCVGFLYTVKLNLPAVSLVVLASSMGMVLFSSSSRVNLMEGWMALMWLVKSSRSDSSKATIVSSTYLFHREISYMKVLMAFSSNHSMKRFRYYGADRGTHGGAYFLGVNDSVVEELGRLQACK